MKYIKLFESFTSSPALIVAQGDWKGITLDGSPDQWVHPSRYTVTYYSAPSQDQLPLDYQKDPADYILAAPEEIAEEVFGGDQNGSNLTQSANNQVEVLVDPSYSVKDIFDELLRTIDLINTDHSIEAGTCQSILEEPNAQSIYTPEFLAHCRAVVENDPIAQKYLENPDYALPQENSMGPKEFMQRELVFNEG